MSGDDLGTLFENRSYDSFLQFLPTLRIRQKSKELKNPAIVAAMFGTFSEAETRARTFWTEVSRGGDEEQASGVLDGQLLKNADVDPSKKLKPHQLYGLAVRAWNCHVSKSTVPSAFKQQDKKQLPEILS